VKRILLFVATNIAILLVLSVVLRVLGLERILDEQGVNLDLPALLGFAAVLGMGGSFLSLLLSKWMAKRMMGVQLITEPRGDAEMWLVQTVRRHADACGIGMPEVGVFDDPSPNAFATGARRDAALVAVSTGLLRSMGRDEVDAVLGHEVSHVANGDMITLTLIQGVVNTFVIFLSRVIGHTVDRVVFRTERGHGPAYIVTVLVSQLLLGILASLIVMWFSRQREFRADAGGARLASRPAMIGALEALSRRAGEPLPEQMQAFGISAGKAQRFSRLFMTHPPIADRIAALKNAAA
jgi:heat shock protein HtpX